MKRLQIIGSVIVAVTVVSGCGLFGGGTGLTKPCEVAAKTLASNFVEFVGAQVDDDVPDVARVAATTATESMEDLMAQCEGDELGGAVSLFLVTVGKAATTEEPERQGALYAGVKELCETQIPRRDEQIVLSDDAQAVCGRAATDAIEPDAVVEDVAEGVKRYELRYVLEGAGQATVRFLSPNGTEETQSVKLPWEWSDESQLPLPNMSATIQGNGQAVCAIYIDGERRAEGTVNPDTGTIVCSYDAEFGFLQNTSSSLPPLTGEAEALVNEVLSQYPALQ
jgi:hypothetical protein